MIEEKILKLPWATAWRETRKPLGGDRSESVTYQVRFEDLAYSVSNGIPQIRGHVRIKKARRWFGLLFGFLWPCMNQKTVWSKTTDAIGFRIPLRGNARRDVAESIMNLGLKDSLLFNDNMLLEVLKLPQEDLDKLYARYVKEFETTPTRVRNSSAA